MRGIVRGDFIDIQLSRSNITSFNQGIAEPRDKVLLEGSCKFDAVTPHRVGASDEHFNVDGIFAQFNGKR